MLKKRAKEAELNFGDPEFADMYQQLMRMAPEESTVLIWDLIMRNALAPPIWGDPLPPPLCAGCNVPLTPLPRGAIIYIRSSDDDDDDDAGRALVCPRCATLDDNMLISKVLSRFGITEAVKFRIVRPVSQSH